MLDAAALLRAHLQFVFSQLLPDVPSATPAEQVHNLANASPTRQHRLGLIPGPDWENPDAPMIPSERFDNELARCQRASDDALQQEPKAQTVVFLSAWAGRMTPHVLRHYCASSLYGAGMDLKAIQDILGHEWQSTTTRYIHVSSDHVEQT